MGCIGFRRAIVLLEQGCSEFSNITGLSQIRFPSGDIAARLEEIRASGGNPFTEYQLPQAVLKFKQGFGRLIRSQQDYGTRFGRNGLSVALSCV